VARRWRALSLCRDLLARLETNGLDAQASELAWVMLVNHSAALLCALI